MMKSRKKKMVTEAELEAAFKGTLFGPDPSYEYIVKWGLMKVTCGYATGYTVKMILRELGLLNKSDANPALTTRGRHCLWELFRDGYNH